MGATRDRQTADIKRLNRATSIDQLLKGAVGVAAKRRGFSDERILSEWATIAGPAIARRCQPIKILHGRQAGGTLHLRAASSAALELQHLAPQLIDRINGYFGYRAVVRLQILQAPPVPSSTTCGPATDPPPVNLKAAERGTALVEDRALRDALKSLHLSMQARQQSDKPERTKSG